MKNESVLIIDTPKNCFECLAQMGGYCFASKEEDAKIAETTEELIAIGGKPKWCPLRPLPNKLELRKQEEWLGDVDRYEVGYNACLDEIIGETE